MSNSRLKLLLLAIWGTIAVLGGALAIWALTGPGKQALPVEIVATPSASPAPWFSPTPLPTTIIIKATRNPNTPIPIPPTNTPPKPGSYVYDPSGLLPGFNPLTGLKAPFPALMERRPVAVKISNFPRSLRAYQSGLTMADTVYEYYIEDGLSRFVAVYYGQDATRAGPVRSGRYFDENIMRMYHSVLVFASADERVRNYLIDNNELRPFLFIPRDDNCPPLCRDTTIEGYNNYFVDTSGVGAFLSDNGKPTLQPIFFSELFKTLNATSISRVFTRYSAYSYNYWEYDPAQKKYLRYSDTTDDLGRKTETYAPHIDHLTNQQLSADNVVELVVPHLFRNDFDRADQVFYIEIVGSGDAYVFRNGNMYKVKWVRNAADQPFRLFDNSNLPFALKPGVTYYQVINPESSISQSGLSMRFDFFIPPRVLTPTPTEPKAIPAIKKPNH